MFDSARSHFVQSVLPAYESYVQARDQDEFGLNQQTRVGLIVAAELYHFREHLVPHVSHGLFESCADYRLVRDVTNLAKHKAITNYQPSVQQIGEVRYTISYEDEQGVYWSSYQEVLLKLRNGSERLLAEAIWNVTNEWCRRLRENGIIDVPGRKSILRPAFIARGAARSLEPQVQQTDASKFGARHMRYDPTTQTLLPLGPLDRS